MSSIPAVLVNYNYKPEWLEGESFSDLTIYDRSDDDSLEYLQSLAKRGFSVIETKKQGKTVLGIDAPIKLYKTKNVGDVDYDKLGYLVEHYDNLPDVFLWGKTNLLKYVDKEYLDQALLRSDFTPLLKLDHKTYSDKWGVVNYYQDGVYHERADSWFFHNPDLAHKYFHTWQEWAHAFNLPAVDYIPFAPGGNYILTRERVHRYSKDFYQEMRDTLNYAMHPAEAHAAERSYYLLWR